jgi:hypothetical protein
MTERDTDIEFDFFDEPETHEAAETERVRTGKGGPGPPGRPGPGVTPLLRLVGLIAFAILIVVLLVFAVNSCRGSSKQSTYKNYMDKVKGVGVESQTIGHDLNSMLTTAGLKQSQISPRLAGFAQRQQQLVTRAQSITSPGSLRAQQQHAVEALQLRVDGLRGLSSAFQQTAKVKDLTAAGTTLASQATRLLASDVIWDDFFRQGSIAELQRQGITNVAVPESHFVSTPDVASSRYWVAILQRLRPSSSSGATGLHGTGIVGTEALPAKQQLSETQENTVTASPDLAFAVSVKNTGDFQEVGIQVTLTIQQQTPIVKTATIDLINTGEVQTVTFKNLGQPEFATKTTVKVDVQPVPGEVNKTNNSASYPVIFSLG